MGILDFLGRKPVSEVADTEAALQTGTDDETKEELGKLLGAYRTETKNFGWENKLTDFESGKRILALGAAEQGALLLLASAALAQAVQRKFGVGWPEQLGLRKLVERIMSRKLPLETDQVEILCDIFADSDGNSYELPFGRLARLVERHLESHAITPELEGAVRKVKKKFGRFPDAESRKLAARFQRILDGERANVVTIEPGDAWADTLIEKLNALPHSSHGEWTALLAHARTATSAKPSARWRKQMASLVEAVGAESYASVVTELLQQIGKVGSRSEPVRRGWSTLEPTMVDDQQADLLRGLIWGSSLTKDENVYRALGQSAEQAYKKVPGVGPRAPKIGNACVHVLAAAEDPSAIVQLSRLKTRVKHASVKEQVDKALQAAADKIGVTREDLEERAAPDFGMREVGVLRRRVGEFEAQVRIVDCGTVELRWMKQDGRVQKSIPKAVKEHHASALAELKRTVKEIRQALPAVRARIERLMVDPRSWSLTEWKERYLDQPLVGVMARRLIWHFENEDGGKTQGIWSPEGLVGVDGKAVDSIGESTRVSLWHPIGFEPDEVLAWRRWLEEHEITQPFKQAHREVYILTDAELATGTYSNRFAAHLLRQHQFSALAQQRGWRYTLQGAWDSHNTPYLQLPQWELTAQFWVEGVGDYGADTSEMGIFLYVSTDQVRFYRATAPDEGDRMWDGIAGNAEPLPLSDVPALPFSEVMRDVDLFVGVASIGNDPTWGDRGNQDRYYGYWHDYSFGELGASATTRKQVLENLVPKLKIADRCSFSEKFLVVRGDLRTYKIHFGSGNILMEPNNQYLCIVPDRSPRRSGSVFLPFEGDGTMDVILSKAFMLAEDTKVQDRQIRSQIRRG